MHTYHLTKCLLLFHSLRRNFFTSSGLLISCFLFCLVSAYATVITVPGDFPAIQSAIDSANDGDEIIVSPGTYVENINFKGKNIIVRSTDPTSPSLVATTVIDGANSDTVVTFTGTELTTCVLAGFTITNGYASLGGGIFGNGTLATIQNNIIADNTAYRGGGLYECNGIIQNNHINNNTATGYGGGLCKCNGIVQDNIISFNTVSSPPGAPDCGGGGICDCDGIIQNNTISDNLVSGATINIGGGLFFCDGLIQNNVISGNSAIGTYSFGGGVSHFHGTIQNNIIFGNSATTGGGLSVCNGTIQNDTIYANAAVARGGGLFSCDNIIRNCIIWENMAPDDAELADCSIPSYSTIKDWTGGGTGNIVADPKLVNPLLGDFHLQSTSPCIDAGCMVSGLEEDFEGDPRPFDGTPEPRGDGSDIDIGADEFIMGSTAVHHKNWVLYE